MRIDVSAQSKTHGSRCGSKLVGGNQGEDGEGNSSNSSLKPKAQKRANRLNCRPLRSQRQTDNAWVGRAEEERGMKRRLGGYTGQERMIK
jgi:hypothetical protein